MQNYSCREERCWKRCCQVFGGPLVWILVVGSRHYLHLGGFGLGQHWIQVEAGVVVAWSPAGIATSGTLIRDKRCWRGKTSCFLVRMPSLRCCLLRIGLSGTLTWPLLIFNPKGTPVHASCHCGF